MNTVKIDLSQPHMLKAIEYFINNNMLITPELLVIVDNTYKDEANKGIINKVKDVIQELESSIEKVSTDPRWKLKNGLHDFETELRDYVKDFEKCLKSLETDRKIIL